MRTFRTQDDKNKLFFTNYKRIDEEIVFNEIMQILKDNPNIKISDKEIAPSEDMYRCSISDKGFELIFDIDYGGYIYSNSEKTLEILEKILN